MGATDMLQSGFDADTARYNRDNRLNPAEFAPGQGEPIAMDDSMFPTSTTQNNTGQFNDVFGSGFGGGAGGNIADPFSANASSPMGVFDTGTGGLGVGGNSLTVPNQGAMQAQPQKDASDKFWDAMIAGGKGFSGFIKDISGSFGLVTPLFWTKYGLRTCYIGIGTTALGVVTKLFGLDSGLKLAIGGALATAVSVTIWMFSADNARNCRSEYKDEDNSQQNFNNPTPEPAFSGVGGDFDMGDSFGNGDFSGFDSGSSGDDWGDSSSDDEWETGGFSDDDEDEWGEMIDDIDSSAQPEAGMSAEEALNSMQEIPKGMYTREYLYDMFTKVLPTMKPDFYVLRDIDDDDDVFLAWDERLQEAAGVSGCKDEDYPELTSLQENLFTIIVTCTRPRGLKTDQLAAELANIYAYRNGTRDDRVFAKADNIGASCKITIFSGAAAMISLKDMMLVDTKFIKDSDNYMPVILGVDQLGNIIHADFKKLESVIITGMPRSGKSWFVQAVLTQLCAFVSPEELNIYICDPKEGISDFKAFVLPHVKKFVSADMKIVETLRNLVKIEAPRRKKIIGDAGFVNIWDYKTRYPDMKIPIIYVVVDEVVTLASRMDKDTNNEFRMLLRELISQLPALGIRAFLIPHVLNNDIIEKKTSDLVPCKISICGDADHIEKATGSKPKDFPYQLTNKGDMAVKLSGFNNTLYVHSPALTKSNPENNELFDYLRRVWTKLEPESATDGVAKDAENDAANRRILIAAENDELDFDLFSDEEENEESGGLSQLLDDDTDF